MREGVVLDCGRRTAGRGRKEDDDYWLELYVMLSRATRIQDLLLMRAPPCDFLLRGPPLGLRQLMQKFANRTEECRREARALITELGFDDLLHPN